MSLPQVDEEYLRDRNLNFSVSVEANMLCIVIKGYALPSGYNVSHADLLLRLSTGYPDIPPDMWWFDPPVRPIDGHAIPATDTVECHLGRSWQRWSRHLSAGQWHSGVDCLESFLALIRKELERSVSLAAV